jgi:GDPmannose 4,6-dehydratase
MAGGAESPHTALITGISGQDGSYLAELLLAKGYEVTGMIRGAPEDRLGASEHLRDQVRLIRGELTDHDSLAHAVVQAQPDELYHLAAPSFAPASWARPATIVTAIAGATARMLETVRDHSPDTRVFVASSGAIFGSTPESPQREDTPCRPETPYAAAKLLAHELTGMMRAHDRIFACSGILYNHESERRPTSFVPRKITQAAAEIKLGMRQSVRLGDIDAIRDWSFAGDIVRGAWLTLQQQAPDDYILASGNAHTVAELAEIAFACVELDPREHIELDASLRRAPEPTPRVGDPTRARTRLGWEPEVSFEELIHRMVDADLSALRAGGEDARPVVE